jgi:hypothetical protein
VAAQATRDGKNPSAVSDVVRRQQPKAYIERRSGNPKPVQRGPSPRSESVTDSPRSGSDPDKLTVKTRSTRFS